MASSNPSRFLGDDRALALKMFWGKILEAFRESTMLWNPTNESGANVIAQKEISGTGGKSWQFPLLGDDPTAEDHTPGTELLGQTISMDEGEITMDDTVVAHNDVPLDQTKLSHFQVIEPFARKLGRSVALKLDKRAIHTAILAARTPAKTGYHSGGNVVARVGATAISDAYPNSEIGADRFRQDAAELARLMDDDNVPEAGRFLFITPYIRQILGNSKVLFNADHNRNTANDMNKRVIAVIEGFNVQVAPGSRIPTTNVTTGLTKYQGNFSRTGPTGEPVAIALTGAQEGEAAVGAVMAGGLMAHNHFDERRNTTFLKAQALMGFGKLCVWCAGEIRVPSA